LDDIINSQKPHHDKSRLGYNQIEKGLLAQGKTEGLAPRAHQQALTIGPFGNTCEVDAVSPEEVMRGL
jgi:hypothetical protein